MNTKDLLIAIKAQIDTPDKWTKELYARDSDGSAVMVGDPNAKCFCISGAIEIICDFNTPEYWASRKALDDRLPKKTIIREFNDKEDTTHQDVMDLFDRAIEAAS